MPQPWEYWTETESEEELDGWLNRMGAKGWELVCLRLQRMDAPLYIFKRRVPEDRDDPTEDRDL